MSEFLDPISCALAVALDQLTRTAPDIPSGREGIWQSVKPYVACVKRVPDLTRDGREKNNRLADQHSRDLAAPELTGCSLEMRNDQLQRALTSC